MDMQRVPDEILTDASIKLLIVSATYRCYTNWCETNGLNPNGRRTVFVPEVSQLYGYGPLRCAVVKVCNIWSLLGNVRASLRIEEQLRIMEALGTPIYWDECLHIGNGVTENASSN